MRSQLFIALYAFFIVAGAASAGDWVHWRGPAQNGVSLEIDLVTSWSLEGENLLWRSAFTGRSTPIVLGGRVYVIGRTGKDVTEQELVACFDGESGKLLWEHKFNVFHTTIPFNRVGWASPAGDSSTGYVYAHGVQGMFFCFDRDGKVVWSRSLTEEYGRISGYGGRTNTPFVHGNLVVISYLSTSWGSHASPRHRFIGFEKGTGKVAWVTTVGGPPKDTTYSAPILMTVEGRDLLVSGTADGSIQALEFATGQKVWGFNLSKRGLNSSVVASGNYVYGSHSEENFDSGALGRVVCIDATGQGDVTKTHEVWRYDGQTVGYTSPVLDGDRLYVVDNSANVHCLDSTTGKLHWKYSVGTVGKGSPILANGKLYATEVNGGFHIVDVTGDEPKTIDKKRIERIPGVHAEIYGSPAVSNGRIYFTTEEGLYCLASEKAMMLRSKRGSSKPAFDATLPPARVQIRPAEVAVKPGETLEFSAHLFNAIGQEMWQTNGTWGMQELRGKFGNSGKITLSGDLNGQTGLVTFDFGELTGSARVRVVPSLPYEEDFENSKLGSYPSFWVSAAGKFKVVEMDGGKVLVKPPAVRALHRSTVLIGSSNDAGYTIQVDLMGTRKRRVRSDVGLVSHRYTLDLIGNHQRLQVRSWASDLRMAKTVNFVWAVDVWYTMKLKVEQEPDKTVVLGKVWKRGTDEPADWTIRAEDPLPIRAGSAGIYGYSPTNVYYDNIKIW
ncbi:MAG: PQQ-binding-like beta-propeller repeat protein [Candidatus Latescibacterota bacterium]|nr:PQQ-binding-like beta-propeller repeat protein [Candidatus Latescibacterota bacterium]